MCCAHAQAGYVSQALQLAYDTNKFSALQQVSESLSDDADPQLLLCAAKFFLANSQFDRAVSLLANAKQVSSRRPQIINVHETKHFLKYQAEKCQSPISGRNDV